MAHDSDRPKVDNTGTDPKDFIPPPGQLPYNAADDTHVAEMAAQYRESSPETQKPLFKVGSKVQLKTGSSTMVVERVFESEGQPCALCLWWGAERLAFGLGFGSPAPSTLHERRIPLACLVVIP